MTYQLRPMRRDDKDRVRAWRNHPDVAKYMYTDHEITAEEHARWFESVLQDDSSRFWVITNNGVAIGLLSISQIDRHNGRCYWAYYLDPAHRAKGAGSFAEYSVLQHVFDVLQLNKLCGEVLGFNRAVLKMHKRFGFSEEGTLRNHVYKQGQWHDVVCVGILRDEWERTRPEIESRLKADGILS